MGENKNLPPLTARVILQCLLEPSHLFIIDSHLVRSVDSVTENGGAQTDKQSLIRDLANELWCGLVVCTQEKLKVFLISLEFVEAFKIMVSTNYFVWNPKATQEFSGQFVALRRTCKQLRCFFRADTRSNATSITCSMDA